MGMALVHLRSNKKSDALRLAEEVLKFVQQQPLDRTNEGFFVYFSLYKVMQELKDVRESEVAQLAYEQLQVRAQTLRSPDKYEMFWRNLPGHAEIRERVVELSALNGKA